MDQGGVEGGGETDNDTIRCMTLSKKDLRKKTGNRRTLSVERKKNL